MSWGERSFFLSGSRVQRPPPPGGGGGGGGQLLMSLIYKAGLYYVVR